MFFADNLCDQLKLYFKQYNLSYYLDLEKNVLFSLR